MTEHYCFSTPLGEWTVYARDGALVRLVFEKTEGGEKTPLLTKAADQLAEYFAGRRKEFDLPLNPEGTDFQRKIWNALQKIPFGETRSYKQLAEMAGNGKACRAAGGANNKNPLPVFIPCHRVIGATGVRSVTEAVSKSNNFCWSWKKNAADCPFLIAACRGFPA